jgi:hypothetical protein
MLSKLFKKGFLASGLIKHIKVRFLLLVFARGGHFIPYISYKLRMLIIFIIIVLSIPRNHLNNLSSLAIQRQSIIQRITSNRLFQVLIKYLINFQIPRRKLRKSSVLLRKWFTSI